MATLGRSPGAAPLTSADIPDDSITGAKIVDDAIDSEHYAAGSVDAAHVAADVATQAELDAIASVPANLVAYRASGESTPSGWSEYTSCRGRMIVGLQSGGADAGTVGTALTTAQDKSKSIAHFHTLGIGQDASWSYGVNGNHHGSSGTFGSNEYDGTSNFSGSAPGEAKSSAMSANTTVVTSDILAYIQLMTIKKD